MESLGKALDRTGKSVSQGLTVYGNKGSTDQHAYVQQLRDGRHDFFALFVQVLDDQSCVDREVAPGANVGDFLQGFLLGTRRALSDGGRASLTLTVPRVDAYTVGGLIALFERAVCMYGSLVGINAYHQPGVEAGKKAASDILELSRALREVLKRGPASVKALAKQLGAREMDVFYLLERLALTGRIARRGEGTDAMYFVEHAS
jgi:glucose-6-phosphate isomerase